MCFVIDQAIMLLPCSYYARTMLALCGSTVNVAAAGTRGIIQNEATLDPPNFKAIWWLDVAVHTSKHVCRVVFDLGGSASGFLIDDDLLMTNNHVFGTKDDVASAKLQLNYEIQADRTTIGSVDAWEPDPIMRKQ